jgi:hypothetical protein
LATIDSDEEWDRFLEASKDWKNHKYMRAGMKEPRWCTAWVGARKEEDSWQWVDSGAGVPKKYFGANEFDNTDEGRGYGSFMPLGQSKQSPSDQDGRGLLYNTQSLDWSVHGFIIERQAIFSSTYTLNAWAVSDHPRAKELGADKFYSSLQEAGGELPLFSEGTGPLVRPQASDQPPASFWHGGQSGLGMSRLCIDRYGNMANNVARADGSVENVKLMDLWRQPWHRGWQAPSTVPGFEK